jgi:hypothetical protein
MLPVSLPTSPSHLVSGGTDLAQQRGSFSAPAGGARMRWVPAETQASPPGKLFKKPPQPATPESSSPLDKLPASTPLPARTPLPTRTLAAFEKLQQQLDRCDKRDLADYASVLRVSDHAAVLGTDALMKLPGQIRDAKASVSRAINALKACDQMPTREQQLTYARTHNKAAAVLQGLKRSRPLPPPRVHEADAMGNLIPGGERRSKNAHPRTSSSVRPRPLPPPAAPTYPRPPVSAANMRQPHERSYVESLRASTAPPCPVHFPEKAPVKLVSGATKQQRDAHWQGKQIDREKKLWSNATLEKGNMADALGATEEALTHYLAQQQAMLTPERLNAVTSALERLAPLKKKCKELDPEDTSPTARACRAKASQENIRACNLLGSFMRLRRTPEKARLEKPLLTKPIKPVITPIIKSIKSISQRLPTVPEASVLTAASIAASNAVLKAIVKPMPQPITQTVQTTPHTEAQIDIAVKPRRRWEVPINPFTPHLSPDKGYDSNEKINAEEDMKFLDAPFLLDDTLPSWARRGLLNLARNV